MAFDPVPWAVTGSQMDTFVMREFANIATRDAEGVQLPGHGKVTASGTNVNVAAGGLVVKNRQASGQSYVGYMASDTLVPIPNNSSGATQSHLIVATIKDPDFSPWSPWPGGTPANTILFGPYFYPERLTATTSTVRASQLVSYSAVALARVDMPAGASTVLSGYITDLRTLVNPRNGFASALLAGPSPTDFLTVSDTSYLTFPNNATIGVTVPTWATNCIVQIDINQVKGQGSGDFEGRVNLGGLTSAQTVFFDYLGNGIGSSFIEGIPYTVFADLDVRTLQGQTVTCSMQARRINQGINTGSIWVDAQQQIKFRLDFVERTV